MEDEWIVILLMNVMVVMRLMIRTICQRIPRPSSASSCILSILAGAPSEENSSPVLKPSLACQIFLFQNLSISPEKNEHKRSGTKKAVSFLSGGSLK